jgi:hypothetical protein
MATGRDRIVSAADLALVERQVSEWEDSCAVVWGEWLAALMVAQVTLPQTRVFWH